MFKRVSVEFCRDILIRRTQCLLKCLNFSNSFTLVRPHIYAKPHCSPRCPPKGRRKGEQLYSRREEGRQRVTGPFHVCKTRSLQRVPLTGKGESEQVPETKLITGEGTGVWKKEKVRGIYHDGLTQISRRDWFTRNQGFGRLRYCTKNRSVSSEWYYSRGETSKEDV